MNSTHTTFELLEQRHVPALQALAQVYQHPDTGARHLHLATDELEIGFLVGFPTLPETDDGRAHILEHTVLCGSERFPVRDPFFSMMQRSVATFMNAMTYADRTVYPFATTDHADFDNLLEVYLDAVFFPRLDRTSFLQEGWRAELHEGQCSLHGVVFNEMKNSYSSPHRTLYRGLMKELFAGTTYGVDSGGDPLSIPSLSYETLREFHASHYHPSQAVFMSSGPIDPARVQSHIETRVMTRLTGSAPRLLPGLVPPWAGPRQAALSLPAGAGTGAEEHGLQLAWRFDGVATTDDKLRLTALMQLLAGHDGAPIPQAIRALGSGRPSNLMGADMSARQAVMHLGVSGLRAGQIDSAHDVLMTSLQRVAREGLPSESVDGVLRQLRFGGRQQIPGYRRLVEVADAGLRGENMLDAIDSELPLVRLAALMREPDFLQREVQRLLACTNHLRVHVQPDEHFAAAREALEQALLAKYTAALDEPARQRLKAESAALAQHQSKPEQAADVLPRILPAELSPTPRPLMKVQPDDYGNIVAALATNGLSHADIVVDVSAFAAADAPWLALLSRLLPDMGAGGQPPAQALAWRETLVQDFQVGLRSRQRVDGALQVEFFLSASALREDQAGLTSVLAAWFAAPDMDDAAHLRSLVARDLQRQVASLAGSASDMARLALLAPLQPAAEFDNRVDGLPSLGFFGDIRASLSSDQGFAALQSRLAQVLLNVQSAPRHLLCAAMDEDVGPLAEALAAAIPQPDATAAAAAASAAAAVPLDAGAALALMVPVQVNSCAIAWPVPKLGSAQAPALAVAAQLLTQKFLHPAVRERGGAYGVQARYDGRAGVFSITSMADPRLASTYADFAKSLQDIQQEDIQREAVENAILSVIKGLDRPLLPVERLHQAWEAWRRGSDEAEREQFRAGVLRCTLEEVRRALAQGLNEMQARRAAVAASGLQDKDLDGLRAVDLMGAAAEAGCMDSSV